MPGPVRTAAVLAALALVVVLPACGGGSHANTSTTVAATGTAEQQVRHALHAYVRAIAAGDAPAVCAMLTDAARKATATKTGPCETSLATAFRQLGGAVSLRELAARYKVAKVTVHGDTAVVTTADPEQTPVELVRADGAWKLQNATA
jgi:hypothetical protein